MSPPARDLLANRMTEQEYLESESFSEVRREFIDGSVFAMTGAHANHNLIAGNLHTALNIHLKGKPCRPYISDMRVKVAGDYYYPDVLVNCPPVSGYFTESPCLIVEVLSKSTRRMDESVKRLAYMQIPGLQEYVIVEQDFVKVEVMRRCEDWHSCVYFLGDSVELVSVGLRVAVGDIYDGVDNADVGDWVERMGAGN